MNPFPPKCNAVPRIVGVSVPSFEVPCNLDSAPESGEEWLPLAGFEWGYEISNHGRLRSIRAYRHPNAPLREIPLVIRPSLSPSGLRMYIWSLEKRYALNLAKAVWTAFNGRPLMPHERLTYKDGSQFNCAFDNLECTVKPGIYTVARSDYYAD